MGTREKTVPETGAENEVFAVEGPKPRAGLTAGMRRLLWIVGAVVAAGLIAAGILLAAGPNSTTQDGTTQNGAAAQDGDIGEAQHPDDGTDAAGPSGDPTPTQGPIPGAEPTSGSEVTEPEPESSGENRLPPPPEPTPLVDAPLPASAAKAGVLVAGFPERLMGPADGSDVVSSSISTEGPRMQVTLVARTDATSDDVRSHYRRLWADLGLPLSPASPGVDTAFTDGYSSLTLGFSTGSGTGTLYMITGVFKTG